MTLTVREALRMPELRRARVEAGMAGLDRQVLWVDIVDIPEIWLSGGELVLSSGAGWPEDPGRRAGFLRQFDEAGAAGVVIALGRFLQELDPEMKAVADERRLPLISVPWDTPFTQVTRAIAQKALEAERSLYYVLVGDRTPEEVEELASGLGLQPQSVYLCWIVVVRGGQEEMPSRESRVGLALTRAFQDREGRYFRLDGTGRVMVLVEWPRLPADPLLYAERLRRELARLIPPEDFYIALGLPHRGFSGLRRSFREAYASAKFGAFGAGLVPFERVEPASLLEAAPREAVAEFWRRTIGKVREERPDLAATLEVLARVGFNQRLAAKSLHVHKNTLRYRLEHLESILGCSLADPDVRFRIRLAVEADKVLHEDAEVLERATRQRYTVMRRKEVDPA